MNREYLDKGIKEIIGNYPLIGEILNRYGIGCVTCSVGSCKLGDIVAIHNLPADQENRMMREITGVILPGFNDQSADDVVVTEQSVTQPKAIKYSPPVRMLVVEHDLIKRLLAVIPSAIDRIDLNNPDDRKTAAGMIDFIRSYADRFHHAKEEDILFKSIDEKSAIIDVMYADHKTGRGYVAEAADSIDKCDVDRFRNNVLSYRDLLTEHIRKEDEILYPWIDRQLNDRQIGELYKKFTALEDPQLSKRYVNLVADAERRYQAAL